MAALTAAPPVPQVFYQMSTTNKSFLNMHYILILL